MSAPPTAATLLRGVDRAAFVVALGEQLRRAGVPVPLPALSACADAWAVAPPVDLSALYWLTRVTLVGRAEDLATFDRVFDAVFTDAELPLAGQAGNPPAPSVEDLLAPGATPSGAEETGGGLPWHTLPQPVGADDDVPEVRLLPELLPAAVEGLADTPFEELDEAGLALVGAWLERARWRWPTRRGRRRRVHPAGRRVALRDTIAASRRTGYEPLTLVRTRAVRRARAVTVLVDVSESMAPYATAYLHLTRALARSGHAEAFAFSTALTRVTPALRHHSARVAVEQATEQVSDRFGGTHLATSLSSLLASRQGHGLRGGVLVVASDGWDSEDPERLAAVLTRVRRRVHRLVWLNPRAAAPGFEPLVGSMAAALPFCDAFVPAHTLRATLEALGVLLERDLVSSTG